MRWGLLKFLLIPLLFYAYLQFINMLVQGTVTIPTVGPGVVGGAGVVIGVGETVSISVTRSYFFGLLRLPVYTAGLGSIAYLHEAFFTFLGVLTAVFVFMEIWALRRPQKKFRYSLEKTETRGEMVVMPVARRLAKAIGVGALVWLLTFFISLGTASAAAPAAGVLAAYLEFRIKK